jgi:Flp pilus assembly protein TadD
LSLISGLLSTSVDNAAHIGGTVSGLVIGSALAWTIRSGANNATFRQRWLLVSAAAVMAIPFVFLIKVRSDVIELHRGGLALERNDPASAIPHIQRFVAKNPNDTVGHSELGYAYGHLNKYEEAALEYRRVLEVDPKNPVAQYDLARIYYSMNRLPQAVALFETSVFKLPPDSDKYFNLALALKETGQMERAEQVAETAVSLDPKSSRNHFLLSTILAALGKTDRAASERRLSERLRLNQ